MIGVGKVLTLVLALGAMGAVGMREISNACAPAMKADGHGHGGGHGHDEAAKHAEGFGTRYCEVGLLQALKETAGLTPTVTVAKAEMPGAHDDGKKDEHDHKAGDDHKGHDHGAKSDPKAAAPNALVKDAHDHGAAGHKDEAVMPAAKNMTPANKAADAKDDGHGHGAGGHAAHGDKSGGEGFVKMTAAQIAAGGIDMAPVLSGTLSKEITVPGRLTINANAQARVVPKFAGTVAEVMKQAGDKVAKGDVLARLESREMAEAKSEFLGAVRTVDLTKETLKREERLWKQKVTAEQDYINAKSAHKDSEIKLDLAHQRLHTLGLPDDEIEALPKSRDREKDRLYELRAPIAGRIMTRDLILGQIVGTDKEVFSIADLTALWVEMAVAPQDLPYANEGQDVVISSATKTTNAKVMLVNPTIDPETRAAKVIAQLDNAAGDWRPGDFVNAKLLSGKQDVGMLVSREAIQTVNGKTVVFVSEGGGFKMRPVTTGREDTANVEIVSGLEFAETVAIKNTFTLKAELGKAEAEHEH
jgi:membrane fusion protein, heavy metal efflux system